MNIKIGDISRVVKKAFEIMLENTLAPLFKLLALHICCIFQNYPDAERRTHLPCIKSLFQWEFAPKACKEEVGNLKRVTAEIRSEIRIFLKPIVPILTPKYLMFSYCSYICKVKQFH
jgi:hypothetical protein